MKIRPVGSELFHAKMLSKEGEQKHDKKEIRI